jgi:hypothetical protein
MSLNQQVLPGYAAFHIGRLSSEQQAVLDAAEAVARRSAEGEEVDEDPSDRPDAESGAEEEREE